MKKFILLTILFTSFFFVQKAEATAYYINDTSVNTGSDANNGTSTSTAWYSLAKFANNARTVGDIVFVRRGNATTTATTADLTFTTDGNLNNPITITADYDNLWSDFATSTETATLTFGNTYIPLSASSTQFTTSNMWIYVAGDCSETYNASTLNPCEFAYEVASTDSTGITLYLPYKGNQTGAGLYLRIMPSAPQWNTITGEFNWTMSGDDYWYFMGIDVRGTDSYCGIQTSSSRGTILKDMIFQGNGVTDCGIASVAPGIYINKVRTFGQKEGITYRTGGFFNNILIDCNNVASSIGFSIFSSIYLERIYNIEIKNCASNFSGSSNRAGEIYLQNIKYTNTSGFVSISASAYARFFFEDDFGIVGLNSQSSNQISDNTKATTTISTTVNLRSGGGSTNELIYPPTGTANTGLSTKYFPFSFIKLFEYPIYADTSNKTYTMYFNSTDTANWTADPTASEFWIECEYYADATDADRQIKKSTGVVDFNGSTAWQSLSVTCQPTQSGVLYLRGWYGKPSDGANTFYMDTTPVISTP